MILSDFFNKNSLRNTLIIFLIFIFSISIIYYSRNSVLSIRKDKSQLYDTVPLYLPDIKAVKFISLGYNSFLASLFWFKTIDYFGSQFASKQSMPWFSYMCELVTELDPKSKHVFEFCGTLMSWIAREPKRCVSLLTRAIEEDGTYWRYYYLRGFTYWYFLEDFHSAKSDFEYASKLPDAPIFLSSLASRLISHSGDIESAIAFLKSGIESSDDVITRKALEERLQLAYVSRDISKLKMVYLKFKDNTGREPNSIEELIAPGYLLSVPIDPYGKPYIYDFESKEFYSEKGKRGLHFPGKTAKTGIAVKEGWESNE